MIRIHRSKPVVFVNGRQVKVTPAEHKLVVTLGMMDNKPVPHDVLLGAMCEGRVQIPADKDVLHVKLSRLGKKIGKEFLLNKRGLGYELSGNVEFVG